MREPLDTFEKYKRLHRDIELRIRDQITAPRNRGRSWTWLTEQMGPKIEHAMYANNFGSRIRFARIVVEHVPHILDAVGGRKLYRVGIALDRHAVPLYRAAEFKLATLRAFVHQMLAGHSFIGIIEPGFYRRGLPEAPQEPTVSWHAHILVWTDNPIFLARQVRAINEREKSFVPGVKPAYKKQLDPEEAEAKLCYYLKAPRDRYTDFPERGEVTDKVTGEIFIGATGRFKQKKDPLRTGEHIAMCRVMEGFYLDKLILGGGDGTAIVESIRKTALAEFRRREALQGR